MIILLWTETPYFSAGYGPRCLLDACPLLSLSYGCLLKLCPAPATGMKPGFECVLTR
jgi:hypothetical protein